MYERIHRPDERQNQISQQDQQLSIQKKAEEENLIQDHQKGTPFHEKGWRGENFAYGFRWKDKKVFSQSGKGGIDDAVPNKLGAPIRTNFTDATQNFVEEGQVPAGFIAFDDPTHRRLYYFTPEPTSTDPNVGYYSYVRSALENPIDAPNKPTNVADPTVVFQNTLQMAGPVQPGGHATGGVFNPAQAVQDVTNPVGGGLSVLQLRQNEIAGIQAAALLNPAIVGVNTFRVNINFNPAALAVPPTGYPQAVVNAFNNGFAAAGTLAIAQIAAWPATIPLAGPMPAWLLGQPPAFFTTVTYNQIINQPGVWVELVTQ
jgi:hypothetical protein